MSAISPVKRSRVRALMALFVFALAAASLTEGVAAGPQDFALIAPASEVSVEEGKATPLDISVNSEKPLPPRAVVVIRNVPSSLRFSEGRLFGPGVWVVSVSALGLLNVEMPEDFSGATLDLTLVALDGVSLAHAAVKLVASRSVSQSGNAPVNAFLPAQIGDAECRSALTLLESVRDHMLF